MASESKQGEELKKAEQEPGIGLDGTNFPGAPWELSISLSFHLIISWMLSHTDFSHLFLPSMSAFLFLFASHLLNKFMSPEPVCSGHFTALALVIANVLWYNSSSTFIKAAVVCKTVFVTFLLQLPLSSDPWQQL